MTQATSSLPIAGAIELYYQLQEDELGSFAFFDHAALTLWDVAPAPGGWSITKTDLQTMRQSQTRGGFHPGAVLATLKDWGLPADAAWTPIPCSRPAERLDQVYLIGSPASRLVKIGHSDDVPRRLADIQRMSPVPLSLLWQHPGGAELEARLHRVFAGRRAHGEWFDFGDDDPITTISKETLR